MRGLGPEISDKLSIPLRLGSPAVYHSAYAAGEARFAAADPENRPTPDQVRGKLFGVML
jgi:hypothetical protein